jgi:hypothetical protein
VAATARSPDMTIDPIAIALRFVLEAQSAINRQKGRAVLGCARHYVFHGCERSARFAKALKPGAMPLPFKHSSFFAPLAEPSIQAGAFAMSMEVMQALQPK